MLLVTKPRQVMLEQYQSGEATGTEREREKLTRNSRRQGRKSMQGVHFRARAERPRTAMLLVSNRHV